jgi:hypothetical protein
MPRLAFSLIRVPQDEISIQIAINQAMGGDTVLISPGIWTERVSIGSGNVTICSNYIFSNDSYDINNTFLDGEFSGTIISVDMDTESRLELNGLTLTRGSGEFDINSDNYTAGGLDFVNAGTVYLSNLVFHNNRAPRNGAALYWCETNWPSRSHVYLNKINCYGNEGDDPQNHSWRSFIIYYVKAIHASKLRISIEEETYSTQSEFSASDSLVVDDCSFSHLEHINSAPVIFSSTNIYGYGGYIELSDIFITDNIFSRRGGFSSETNINGFSKLHNIHLERNYFPQGNMFFDFRGYGHFIADSIFISNNESRKSYALFNSDLPGIIRDLFVIGNHMGSNEHFTPTSPGQNALMFDVSINGAIYQDNINERALADEGEYVDGGSLLYIRRQLADTLFYKNMRFINNQHIDHDVYDFQDVYAPGGGTYPNRGRLIYGIINSPPSYFLMDSCTFIGNSQDNMVPEVEPEFPGGTNYIGNNIQIVNDESMFEMDIRNLQMINCDDGAMLFYNNNKMNINNISIIDCKRSGLQFGNYSTQDTVKCNNIYISGLQQQECYTAPPFLSCFQEALIMGFSHEVITDLSNITIINCDLPFLIRTDPTDANRQFRNGIFFNNNVSYQLEHPLGAPLQFSYCLMPSPHEGNGNIWGVDPNFDVSFGSPWLSSDSPCIDAGDPSPNSMDREDPSRPGFALWPSLGGLRSDIGYTGGPQVALVDTNWVNVPAWEPRIHPVNFKLGVPWPNPFNPVVQIPVELARPSLVRLIVHDLLGQQVAVLHDGLLPAGRRAFHWDAKGQASGLYFVTLQVDLDKTTTRAITLLR